MTTLSSLSSTRLRDATDPAKIAAVVNANEAIGSTKFGIISWVPGMGDLVTRMGEVQTTPTGNTVLARLKTLETALSGLGYATDTAIQDGNVTASLVAAEKGGNLILSNILTSLQNGWSSTVIEANGTSAALVNGPGTFFGFLLGTAGASANVLNIYDSLTAAGTKLLPTIDAVAMPLGMNTMQIRFSTGLSVSLATGTAAKLVLFYRAD